jgi:hypothetical protein
VLPSGERAESTGLATIGEEFCAGCIHQPLGAGAGLALVASGASAQDYPSKPITLLVGLAAGGSGQRGQSAAKVINSNTG